MTAHFETQSTWRDAERPHVAIILDGNGRWAEARGWPRTAGHRAGARAVRRVVEAARQRDLGVLTLFAFSADNWRRPAAEVDALMGLFERYLRAEAARCIETGVRLNVIGRRDRLGPGLVATIEWAESRTAARSKMLLRVAVDYSSRWALARAARRLGGARPLDDRRFLRSLERTCHSLPGVPPVDLLIRTSGEQRLSDFLLWESAYAELLFTPILWPDYDAGDLDAALGELERRQRRFGGVSPAPSPPAVVGRG